MSATRTPTPSAGIRNCPPLKGRGLVVSGNRGSGLDVLRRHGLLMLIPLAMLGLVRFRGRWACGWSPSIYFILLGGVDWSSAFSFLVLESFLIGRPTPMASRLIRRRSWFDEILKCGAWGLGAKAETRRVKVDGRDFWRKVVIWWIFHAKIRMLAQVRSASTLLLLTEFFEKQPRKWEQLNIRPDPRHRLQNAISSMIL